MVDKRIVVIMEAHEKLDSLLPGLADLPVAQRNVREALFWLGAVEAPELKVWTCGACEHRWTEIFEACLQVCPKCDSYEIETTQDYDTYKAAQEIAAQPTTDERFARVTEGSCSR